MTFVGDQFMGIVTLTVVCCLYFIIEGNAKFQLEVSENKDLNFYLNVNLDIHSFFDSSNYLGPTLHDTVCSGCASVNKLGQYAYACIV